MADEAKGVVGVGVDERVKSLEEALSVEKAKNEVLMEQILKAENGLAEKDVEGFADVIPNEDREFWRGQFLENRENATAILNRMRGRVAPAAKTEAAPAASAVPTAAVAPATVLKPLHNREAAPRPASAAGAPAASPADKAAKICNRAQEIARSRGCSFTVAFRCAEQEFGATS
ncbi:MAG: hypothetical protein BWY57_02937 [Betaproteobacteria bacterium ADurb.Bin341]|nr:MAG: hypothetical protein BWY57_02937 [Betaproteobacteria bacterium ADurb.Bin341]